MQRVGGELDLAMQAISAAAGKASASSAGPSWTPASRVAESVHALSG
jgi:hypothetical protein